MPLGGTVDRAHAGRMKDGLGVSVPLCSEFWAGLYLLDHQAPAHSRNASYGVTSEDGPAAPIYNAHVTSKLQTRLQEWCHALIDLNMCASN
jgi:hypothetical protein